MRMSVAVLVALLSLTATASRNVASVERAAPHIIMLHGDLLPEPIYLTDWNLNLDFIVHMTEGEAEKPAVLADRPVVGVAFFWHRPTWARYLEDPALLRTLRPEQARERCMMPFSCQARFYPAHEGAAAVFDLRASSSVSGIVRISDEMRDILAQAGVPLTVD